MSANTVEKFNTFGVSTGQFGSGHCSPHAIVFDARGAGYVGQAGCNGPILKFVEGQPPVAYPVASENYGAFWIDLAPDGCTMFYTSWGRSVKRYDVCADVQLSDFNVAPLSNDTHDLRVLPDGGVLVASGELIARLDAAGVLVQTYAIPGESSAWVGLDLVGDGTFWVGNSETSNVYRFDVESGAVRQSFNTGTGTHSVIGVRVKK
jgi:streptogramin lyase